MAMIQWWLVMMIPQMIQRQPRQLLLYSNNNYLVWSIRSGIHSLAEYNQEDILGLDKLSSHNTVTEQSRSFQDFLFDFFLWKNLAWKKIYYSLSILVKENEWSIKCIAGQMSTRAAVSNICYMEPNIAIYHPPHSTLVS